ncbi:MAG: hypothetical protein M1822_002760 [Bathelium mastoideum]|nr:MAG: hypothetical protein M1822_002760 [Bathelium mastoideum]
MDSFHRDIASTSPTIHSLVVSSILIPAAITSLVVGRFADKVGRPYVVAIGSGMFAVGAALETGAVRLAIFLIGRIISGLGEGLFLSVTVVYICELSPPNRRGTLTGLVQFLTAIGVLIGYFVAYHTVNWPSSASWRVPLSLKAGTAFIYVVSCALLPHSPRWLVLHGRHEEAKILWDRLGIEAPKTQNEGAHSRGSETSVNRIVKETDIVSHSLIRAWRKDVRNRTALGAFTMAMLQLTGIASMLYYSPMIFKETGLVNETTSFLASGVMLVAIVAVTIPGIIIADRGKRKTATIVGGVLISASMIIIGSLYASGSVHSRSGAGRWIVIVMIYVYVLSYCITWAVCFRGYPSEIQPPATRAAASSISQSANWGTSFLVAFIVPIFFAHSSYGPYFLFGFLTFVDVIVCVFWTEETLGQTLEDIDDRWNARHDKDQDTTIESNIPRPDASKEPVTAIHVPADKSVAYKPAA